MTQTAQKERAGTIRTFLLADIRGYTAYTSTAGDHAATQLSELFLTLCREVAGAHEGEVFGTAGDQALVAFSSARQALAAAIALQERLREEQTAHPDLPLSAGIGLDAGEAIQVGGDYRGGAINLAARLCSIARGGEIFASEGVIHLARKTAGICVVDRGEVTLKGFPGGIRVLQIGREGELPDELPPLQPTHVAHPTNLPDEPTPFIGRQQEIAAITRLLQDPHIRLVTLTGPGGTGKTRLALQVGAILLHEYRDGTFFVSLASAADPALVPSALADVLGVKEEAGKELLETLTTYIEEKRLLLVLDNYEHLLASSSIVAQLLDACRKLTILVTSRIPLHLTREHVYPVPPLSVPDLAHLPEVETLSQYEAVALFIERARTVRPDFQVTIDNAPAVAEICYRLDGLPLAIELAAARIKLFPPRALLQRLNRRLHLLTGGAKDKPTRQQTLRGAIDWSYSLLSGEEQRLFALLSVFAGGCTFEAAEAVGNPADEPDFLDIVESLVEKSLLRLEGEEEPRLAMLETIREYAAEKLDEQGRVAQTREAHAQYFLHLAERAEPLLRSGQRDAWLHQLEQEHDNLRVAMRESLTQGHAERALRLAVALTRFWYFQGYLSEGRRWLRAALDLAGSASDPRLRGRAVYGEGLLAFYQSEHENALTAFQESIRVFAEAEDEAGRAYTLMHLGILTEPFEDSRPLLEESVAIFRRSEDSWGLALATFYLGVVTVLKSSHPTDAIPILEESLTRFRQIGDSWGVSGALYYLGLVSERRDDTTAARGYYGEALTLFRSQRDKWRMGVVLLSLVQIDFAEQRFADVPERVREELGLSREIGNDRQLAQSLSVCAALVGVERDYHRMGVLWGAAQALAEAHGWPWQPEGTELAGFEETVATAMNEMGASVWQAAINEGRIMTTDRAIAYALEGIS